MLFRLRREGSEFARITSLPSGWRASAQRCRWAIRPRIKRISRDPSELRRATWRRLVTSKEENSPAMKIFPSVGQRLAQTGASSALPGLKEKSSEPSAFTWQCLFGERIERSKTAADDEFGLGSQESEEIKSSAPRLGFKGRSDSPSAFIRAIQRRPIVL